MERKHKAGEIRRSLRGLQADLVSAGARYSEFALSGSAVMVLYGLKEEVGDIDFFVSPSLFEALANLCGWTVKVPNAYHPPMLEKSLGGIRANCWYDWHRDPERTPHINVQKAISIAVPVSHAFGDWPCVPLTALREWKASGVVPAKHAADVQAIDRYLASQGILPPERR